MMAQLQFAFWDGVGGYADKDANMADVYDEHIRMAQRLEELGWHSYFVIEHQNSPVGRITAPTVFLTAVARATNTLRIGAMMWQLPFYHPLRLAQEADVAARNDKRAEHLCSARFDKTYHYGMLT
jgi:alkanesulfonate monooxygenase SsuD/methylene tetrahydromethanopterin reductase-like flavin-dependent oxidoreductase (luciferase family)